MDEAGQKIQAHYEHHTGGQEVQPEQDEALAAVLAHVGLEGDPHAKEALQADLQRVVDMLAGVADPPELLT